jgi:hypothetical protein
MAFTCFPYNNSIDQFFEDNPFVNYIITQGLGSFRTEDGSYSGNLMNLNYHSGYWINAADCGDDDCQYALNITGVKVDPSLLYTFGSGNNLIGTHGNGPLIESLGGLENANSLFDFVIGEGIASFNIDDGSLQTEWTGNLNGLEPWSGYWIDVKIGSGETYDFQFDFTEDIETISRDLSSIHQVRDEFKVAQSMEQSFYLAEEIIVDDKPANEGDLLLAFNDEVLTGSAIIESGSTTITIMGRDMTEHTIGYHEIGQVPTFKLFSNKTGEVVELNPLESKAWTPMVLHQIGSLTGESPRIVVNQFSFDTPYPNPFNPVTTFKYGLPEEGSVSITVYSLTGEKVTDLMLNEVQSEGLHATEWNATEMAAGVYFINLEVVETDGDKHQKTQKVILLK